MANITTGNFAKALYPGVSAWYGQGYNEHKVEYTDLVDVETSRRAYEEDVGITGLGLAPVKTEGNGISYDTERQAFITRYIHAVYALGFIITREMVEDDLYAVAGKRKAKGLAFSLRQTKETVVANLYNRAFNSTYVGGDGVELCSLLHPNFAGGTWANEPSTAVDLSEAALEQACIDIMKWTNDRGLKIAMMPQTLVVPVDLVFEAERILKTPSRVGTADNDINALYAMGKFPGGIKANHYLTDTDAWFLRTNTGGTQGLKLYQRRKMEFGIDNDFDTENAKFKASERFSVGWTDPRAIYGSPGAS
jgi:phage major head subunit gpT-like protein